MSRDSSRRSRDFTVRLFTRPGGALLLAGALLVCLMGTLASACGDADIILPGSGLPTRPSVVPTGSSRTPTPDDDA